MARTKEFDPDVALDSAMRLFWQHGYEGTSTGALLDRAGIGRASLYATFGSKRELYVAALERFMASASGPMPDDFLSADESPLAAIRRFLDRSVSEPPAGDPAGCFAVNATVEHGDTDPEIASRLESTRRALESAFYSVLLRAQAEGDLAPGVDPKVVASMLVSVNTGLKVLARAGGEQRERMRATIDAVMAMLSAAEPA